MASADIADEDIRAVSEVLRSGRLALGPKSGEFERLVAEFVGVRHAVAVSSGTAALHLLIRGLGIGRGAEVLVPSFTFAASVNAILYESATPVFVDCEPKTYNIDPGDIEHRITSRTRAIMAVDVFGHPAAWDEIESIAEKHNLHVIDDSCEALGAVYRGRRVGSFGDAAAFAFYPNKQMTTGEGGMIVTNDDRLARACRSMMNQGRSEMGAWLEHERLGYNYRMDEMSAALGVSQFGRLTSFLAKRETVARTYTAHLKGLDLVSPPTVLPQVQMSWFVYVVTLAENLERDIVIEGLSRLGIPSRGYFSPLHRQPYIVAELGEQGDGLGVTERIARRTLALPFHNNLTEDQVSTVVAALEKVTSAMVI